MDNIKNISCNLEPKQCCRSGPAQPSPVRHPAAGQPPVRRQPVRRRLCGGDGHRTGEAAKPARRDAQGATGKAESVIIDWIYSKGASIKYVRREGEGGCRPKCGRSKRGCVNLVL